MTTTERWRPRAIRTVPLCLVAVCGVLMAGGCATTVRPENGATVEIRNRGVQSFHVFGRWHVDLEQVDGLPLQATASQAVSWGLTGGNVRCDGPMASCYAFVHLYPGTHVLTVNHIYVHDDPLFHWREKNGKVLLTLDATDHGTYWLEAEDTADALHIWLRDEATGTHVADATVIFPPPPPRKQGSGLRRDQ
jgi:hypothetical protein